MYNYLQYADMVRRLLAAGQVSGTAPMTLEHAIDLVTVAYSCNRTVLVRLLEG